MEEFNGWYKDGKVTFATTHLSTYVISTEFLATLIAFLDVVLGDWFYDAVASYYDAIGWAVANGITNGNSTTKNPFGPTEDCVRGQMITFLYRLFTDTTA